MITVETSMGITSMNSIPLVTSDGLEKCSGHPSTYKTDRKRLNATNVWQRDETVV